MRRREFIALMGGAAIWPLAAHAQIARTQAQQPAKAYRIAVVSPGVPVADMSETGELRSYPAFFKELRRLGYVAAREKRRRRSAETT